MFRIYDLQQRGLLGLGQLFVSLLSRGLGGAEDLELPAAMDSQPFLWLVT